jgi:hypothetical protein
MRKILSHLALQCGIMEKTVHGTGYQTHKEWNDKNAQRASPGTPALFATQSVTVPYTYHPHSTAEVRFKAKSREFHAEPDQVSNDFKVNPF